MEDGRLDLSALAPESDPDRWRAVVDGTLLRVGAVLRERQLRQDPLLMIATWSRPLLAAAAVALALLVPAEVALQRKAPHAEQVRGLAALSKDWAHGTRQPTGADLRRTLGPGAGR